MRVLVRLPNWLGDVLMARAAVASLRALPGITLRAVTTPALVPLAGADEGWEAVDGWPRPGPERGRLVAALRAWRPDAALVMPVSWSSAWLARASGAPRRIGYRAEWRTPLLTEALPRPMRGAMHLSDEYRALAARLGARPVEPQALAVREAARASAAALRARHDVPAGYAIVAPGAIYGPAKRWPAERFAAVGRALVARGLAVLACGASADRDACDAVVAAVGAGAHSLAGQTDLATQAALCADAALAVCNDSGLAHLAAATGAPVVTVFGSTSSAWTAPRGPRAVVVQHAPVCSPCFQRTCAIGYGCLTRVAVAEVLDACDAVQHAQVA